MNPERRFQEAVRDIVREELAAWMATGPKTVGRNKAAEIARIGKDRVTRALTSKALPSTKRGKSYVIAMDDLKRWIAEDCPEQL